MVEVCDNTEYKSTEYIRTKYWSIGTKFIGSEDRAIRTDSNAGPNVIINCGGV